MWWTSSSNLFQLSLFPHLLPFWFWSDVTDEAVPDVAAVRRYDDHSWCVFDSLFRRVCQLQHQKQFEKEESFKATTVSSFEIFTVAQNLEISWTFNWRYRHYWSYFPGYIRNSNSSTNVSERELEGGGADATDKIDEEGDRESDDSRSQEQKGEVDNNDAKKENYHQLKQGRIWTMMGRFQNHNKFLRWSKSTEPLTGRCLKNHWHLCELFATSQTREVVPTLVNRKRTKKEMTSVGNVNSCSESLPQSCP